MLDELRWQFERHKMRSYRERVRTISRRALDLPTQLEEPEARATPSPPRPCHITWLSTSRARRCALSVSASVHLGGAIELPSVCHPGSGRIVRDLCAPVAVTLSQRHDPRDAAQSIPPIAFSRIAPLVGPLHAAVAFVPLDREPGTAGQPLLIGAEAPEPSGGRRGAASVRVVVIGEGLGMASRVRATACGDGAHLAFPL